MLKQIMRYANGNEFSCKQNCMISCARYSNSSKRKRLFMNVCHTRTFAEQKPWDTVHVELKGQYSKSIRKHQTGGSMIKNKVSLTWMTMINPTTGWFEIVEVTTYDLSEVTGSNAEYIDKLSTWVIQFFNSTRISRYLHPRKLVFHNWYELKWDFTPLLKDL